MAEMKPLVKLEIGCGAKRPHRADFIGLDRFPLPGVDIVCNLDTEGIPLPDDHCDLVYASHSLEHVRDLLGCLREIWRVSKPGAQLCIVAPYYSNTLNFANPYHRQNFNEHTPRFWTRSHTSGVDPAEYTESFVWEQGWGLAQSDNSPETLDFRCLRIEFFYYQKYHWLPATTQRALRRSRNNVCHSLMYHLAAFKPPMSEADVALGSVGYYIPPEAVDIRAGLEASGQPSMGRRAWNRATGYLRT